jgi:hypothetical protein
VFTARYALSPYIKQIRFVFKGLKSSIIRVISFIKTRELSSSHCQFISLSFCCPAGRTWPSCVFISNCCCCGRHLSGAHFSSVQCCPCVTCDLCRMLQPVSACGTDDSPVWNVKPTRLTFCVCSFFVISKHVNFTDVDRFFEVKSVQKPVQDLCSVGSLSIGFCLWD